MPEKRTTIRELARLSGVSVGTVSRALNGYTDVSDETRERVIRLAAELDYTPTAAARTLVTQRSHVIGVFLETGEGHPDLQHPFFDEVLVGLKDCIGAAGYDLLLFAEYARLMAEQLGDVVAGWITHNEPWVVAILGHAEGRKAPGLTDWPTALRVAHHLLVSHGLAVQALRAGTPAGTPVGITLNLSPERPESDSEADRAAAWIADGAANRWFLDPVLRGTYPEDLVEVYGRSLGPPDSVLPGDMELIAQPLDFLGVNYYSPHRVAADPAVAPLGVRHAAPLGPLTTMGWEQDPSGLHEILTRLRRDYGALPIYITENGAAFDDGDVVDGVVDDPARVEYLEGHLEALARAIADGVDVRRYYAWSFLDNFEWEHGYDQRFGLVHVDYPTQRRVPKRSALWYRDRIAATRGAR